MGDEDRYAPPRLFRAETVRGEPYYVGGRKLTPVARIVSFGRARGTVGANRVGGWGVGWARIRPLAVVEETEGGERRIAITDPATGAMWGILGAAVAVTVFFATIRWLVRRRRRAAAERAGAEGQE